MGLKAQYFPFDTQFFLLVSSGQLSQAKVAILGLKFTWFPSI